ncbi:hypothetical protein MaudMau93_005696 [Microsporum audouinii]
MDKTHQAAIDLIREKENIKECQRQIDGQDNEMSKWVDHYREIGKPTLDINNVNPVARQAAWESISNLKPEYRHKEDR